MTFQTLYMSSDYIYILFQSCKALFKTPYMIDMARILSNRKAGLVSTAGNLQDTIKRSVYESVTCMTIGLTMGIQPKPREDFIISATTFKPAFRPSLDSSRPLPFSDEFKNAWYFPSTPPTRVLRVVNSSTVATLPLRFTRGPYWLECCILRVSLKHATRHGTSWISSGWRQT
jgi:hypothetical protein